MVKYLQTFKDQLTNPNNITDPLNHLRPILGLFLMSRFERNEYEELPSMKMNTQEHCRTHRSASTENNMWIIADIQVHGLACH